MASPDEGTVFALVGFGAAAGLLFLLAIWGAIRSRRPRPRKPPRKTFEHGRRLGRMQKPTNTDAAVRALGGSQVGQVEAVHASDDRVAVVIRRRRAQPCVQAAGYLAGLFESAWAHEVIVTHPVCAGEGAGDCEYVVQRAPIGSGAPAEGASTRGSGDAPRRSARARRGAA